MATALDDKNITRLGFFKITYFINDEVVVVRQPFPQTRWHCYFPHTNLCLGQCARWHLLPQ